MDPSRTSPSERFAAAGGLLILVGLFTKWYTADGRTISGWHAVHGLRWILMASGVAALGLLVARVYDRRLELPVAPSVLLTGLGGLSAALTFVRWVDHPAPHLSVRIGLFMTLVGAVIQTVGAWQVMDEEDVGQPELRSRVVGVVGTRARDLRARLGDVRRPGA